MNEDIQNSDDLGEVKSDRRRAGFLWLSETVMVGMSVLVFFGFLTILIRVLFPLGTSLTVDPHARNLSDDSWSGNVELGVDTENDEVDTLYVGEILKTRRRVQHRGANSLAWNDANIGDKVVRNDAVQTFARSTAILEVNSDSTLSLSENSLVVFDQQEADPFLSSSNSVLIMVDGELSGTLSGDAKSRFNFGVGLPNGDVTLQTQDPGDDVEFLITVNDDQSTTVNVHEGMAQVIGNDGTRKTIGAQQSLTIDSSGSDLRLSDLSPIPKPTGPSDSAVVTYRNVPQDVQFTWNAVKNADRYRIIIATDPEFADRVVDDHVIGTTFTHGALGSGSYYWTVRSRVGWSQSGQSTVHELKVVRDLTPPVLELDPPPATIRAGTWRLHGRTDSDATVYVDDVPVEHNSGRIDHPIELRPGANVIVVKAIDKLGNLTYAPLQVNAK